MRRYKVWFPILLMALIMLSALVGCRRQPEIGSNLNDDPIQIKDNDTPTEQFFCPLDGLPVTDPDLINRRPLAVIIGNIPTVAEPTGVGHACLVFEMLAEGGITRLMPVFVHQDAPILGSVRSARPYFLEKALEFNAAFAHCGYSPQAKQDISNLKVISLNEFYLPQVYWRVRTKKEPHNVYTSTERLFSELEERGLLMGPSPVQFDFYDDDAGPLGSGAHKATLRFSPSYVVEYEWSEAVNGYLRFVNGKPHRDEDSGQQLVAKNVVVQFVDGKVIDPEGRLEIKLVGQGSGRMFQQGVTYELKWAKHGRTEPTQWTDRNGDSIKFARGQSWIEVLPYGAKVIWE